MDLGAAPYVYIAYFDRGRLTHDEVLCAHHYQDAATRGVYDPEHRGKLIQITPWTGESRCFDCEAADYIRPYSVEGVVR